jgi:hypothetical protein
MLYTIKKLRKKLYPLIFLTILFAFTACSSAQLQPTQGISNPTLPVASGIAVSPFAETISSTQSLSDSPSPVPPTIFPPTSPSSTNSAPTAASDIEISPTALPPDYWMSLPVTPTVSENTHEIYQRGIELGRDPHAFSKIGDCQSISTYFLKYFDLPGLYNLGAYSSLQETIDWFSGSFSRDSLAVQGGFNAAAVLSPLSADPKQCNPSENPIACEFRLHNPSIAIISLEEWWTEKPENYEKYMRQIIEYSIQQGVVPIIATKADNLEGNHLINQTIARLSLEYDIPLWNFWRAVQYLPNHGLIALDTSGNVDMFHLTRREGYYFYNNRVGTRDGWAVRNLTALQTLDSIRRDLTNQP